MTTPIRYSPFGGSGPRLGVADGIGMEDDVVDEIVVIVVERREDVLVVFEVFVVLLVLKPRRDRLLIC